LQPNLLNNLRMQETLNWSILFFFLIKILDELVVWFCFCVFLCEIFYCAWEEPVVPSVKTKCRRY